MKNKILLFVWLTVIIMSFVIIIDKMVTDENIKQICNESGEYIKCIKYYEMCIKTNDYLTCLTRHNIKIKGE